MAMDLNQARQVAAQLAAGLLSRENIELSGDLEQDAEIAVTLFQTIVNKLHPPGTRTVTVGPLNI